MLGMRNTCQPLRKKFPDLEAIEEAGIDWLIKPLLLFLSKWDIGLNKSGLTAGYLLKHEKEILYRVEAQDGASKMCLQVTNWALLLIREGRDAGYFENPSDATRLFEPVLAFKKSCSSVLKFQSTPIPLSFIQV